MKTPGQLLAELLASPSENKRKDLEEESKRVLEAGVPPGTKVTVSVEGFKR